jgi:hypothetical protein
LPQVFHVGPKLHMGIPCRNKIWPRVLEEVLWNMGAKPLAYDPWRLTIRI